ncbi:dTMP kinase [Bowdeniella nasicola]|uniref:Thymidylate kinase n=1 Tax=Bowdeniella nasicola TaxID=208480 RepID=A0A1Q5Q1U7_9ACTO|nr:dTMP kinase [Bowdeniella nasicola]OKL53662.1 dTMP kinase [Bowdeniella nasicola]
MFITFEGGDGAGKSTQIARLAAHLREAGHEVETTFEPGEGELGKELRRLIQHSGDIDARTEALLYAADRAEHVARVVRPALERGAIVLCDRYLDSSVAYQGAGRDLGTEEIRDLSIWATHGLMPDLTLLFDIDPELAATRRTGEPDRLEREPLAFHTQVRENFVAAAHAYPERFVIIDAARTPDEISADVQRIVGERMTGAQS